MWQSIFADYVFLYKLRHLFRSNNYEWFCFNLFKETINYYYYVAMTVRCLRPYFSNDVNFPNCEWPWRSQSLTFHRRHMAHISIDLKIMALLYKLHTICFHGQPEITLTIYFLNKDYSVHMQSTHTFVNCFHDFSDLVLVNTS